MENQTIVEQSENLSRKERLELFENSMHQLIQENETKNVRKLLHERYLKARQEEEEKRLQLKKQEEDEMKQKELLNKDKNKFNKVKIGRQLAKVFRFENNNPNQIRNRGRQLRDNHREQELDPLLNDPNVLFENFALDHSDDEYLDENGEPVNDLPYFPDHTVTEENEDDEYDDDDSFKSLFKSWIKSWTYPQLIFLLLRILIFISGQRIANSYGFGPPFFILATLLFIITNLRKKKPGELSAYSVFNPNCRHIPTVSGSEQPRETIWYQFDHLLR